MEEISDRTLTRLFELPQSKIVDFFRKKKLRPSNSWKELWQEEHNRSFVVAGVTQADILQEIYNEVEKALAEGTTFAEFKKNLKEKWTPEYQERRLRTVYNTNLSVAYSRGRYESMRANAQNRPYWRYKCQFLPGSRESHKALHGKIFRWDDPIWNTLFPPNDWGCQCEVEPLTAEEAGGKVENSDGKLFGIQKNVDSQTKQLVTGYHDSNTDEFVAPAAGWNYNPGISEYLPDMRKYNSFIDNWLKLRINAAAQKFPFIKRDTKKIDFIKELRAVNPHYDPDVKNVYSTNCQRCVVAYEARLRGLDVAAIPADTVQGTEVLSGFKDKSFKSFASKSSIEKQMAEYGDGARMEVLVTWKSDPKKSHAFIAEQIDGKTHFIDPQRKTADCSCHFNNAKNILATRIDNALFSDNLKNFVESTDK